MTHWRPRSPRYEVVRSDGISVHLLQSRADAQPTSIPAQLRQISLGGARLITQTPLVMEDNLGVTISFQEIEFESVVDARIAWARPLRGKDWLIGCAFSPELPEQILNELANNNYIDRRGDSRLVARTPVEFRPETSKVLRPATIVDFSHGGLCLECFDLEKLDRRIELVIDAGERSQLAILRVRWRIATTGEAPNLMGCEFLQQREGTSMRQHLEEAQFASVRV